MEIFYVTFNWNRELFYDGYFILRNDKGIIGYTCNDSILGGNSQEFNEFRERIILKYNISEILHDKKQMLRGFSINVRVNKQIVCIRIKKVQNMDEERIKSRIDEIFPFLSEEVQNILSEGYLNGR